MRRWTQHEKTYLARNYPYKGPQWVADRLGRSREAIKHCAERRGLQSGIPTGYVPLSWVEPAERTKGCKPRALAAARRDRVLLTVPGRLHKYLVPEAWADAYANKLGDENQTIIRTRDWLTTNDITRMTGLPRSTIYRQLKNNTKFGQHLKHVQRELLSWPYEHYRWHPQQARMAINAWKAHRRAA